MFNQLESGDIAEDLLTQKLTNRGHRVWRPAYGGGTTDLYFQSKNGRFPIQVKSARNPCFSTGSWRWEFRNKQNTDYSGHIIAFHAHGTGEWWFCWDDDLGGPKCGYKIPCNFPFEKKRKRRGSYDWSRHWEDWDIFERAGATRLHKEGADATREETAA